MKTVFIFIGTLPLLVGSTLAVAHADEAPGSDLQRLAALVDYVAADYPGAVQGGKVVAETEFEEQRALVRDARALVDTIAPPADKPTARATITADLDELSRAVDGKRSPDEVATLCRTIRGRLVDDYGLTLVPAAPPSWERGQSLYQTACAACHGADGRADTPQALQLNPRPTSLFDAERMPRVSPSLAFHAVTFGTKETAMPSYDTTLSTADRWSLSFYAVALRHDAKAAAVGAELVKSRTTRVVPTTSRLAAVSDAELDAQLAPEVANPVEREQVIAYLRRTASFAAAPGGPFATARSLLAELTKSDTLDRKRAHELATGAYLDGVEPHEAALRARDPELATEIERAFLDLRASLDAGQRGEPVKKRVATLGLLLDRAEQQALDAGGRARGKGVAFLASLTIALREGLETALLIAALLAFLRKSGREQAARLVHAGWLLALPAGVVTWWLAGALIAGARRELVEAVTTLLAALIILGVTHWVLGRVEAQHWVGYLRRKVTARAAEGRGWPLFGLAFFAAYREAAETVLFYRALLLDTGGERGAVVLGAAAGLVGILVVLVVVRHLGRRLNPRPVMLASSALLAALSIALVGRGIRALQEGGYLPLTPLHLPDLSTIGLYPSREGLLAQSAILAAILLPSLLMRLRKPVPPSVAETKSANN